MTYTITILHHHDNWTEEERQLAKDHYMCKLRTVQPEGLNKRHGDFARYFYKAF